MRRLLVAQVGYEPPEEQKPMSAQEAMLLMQQTGGKLEGISTLG